MAIWLGEKKLPRSKLRGITSVIVSFIEASFGELHPARLRGIKLIDKQEFFLAFEHFPWFQDAATRKVLHVEMPSKNYLYWPELDIDLDINSIIYPENYPLVSLKQIEQ